MAVLAYGETWDDLFLLEIAESSKSCGSFPRIGKKVDVEITSDDCATDDFRDDGGVTSSKELLDICVETK